MGRIGGDTCPVHVGIFFAERGIYVLLSTNGEVL